MRLIDADKLNFSEQHYNKSQMKAILDFIDDQPTAYDVNKVVEQLEKLKSQVPVNRILDNIIKDKPKELGQLIAYNKAIEIVKCGFESLPRKSGKDLISKEQLINKLNSTGINITLDLPVEEILGENVNLDDFATLMQDAIQAYRKMIIDTIKNMSAEFSRDKATKQLSAVPTGTYTDTCLRKLAQSEAIGYHERLENKYLETIKTNDLESTAEILNKLKAGDSYGPDIK